MKFLNKNKGVILFYSMIIVGCLLLSYVNTH